jgi:flagellar motor switch protein FliN
MSNQLQAIAQGLAVEFAAVLGSLLGADATSGPFDGAITPAWAIPCRMEGPTAGTFFLGISKPDASALAARLLMSEGEPSDADIADALTEVGGQAFAALVTKALVADLAGSVDRPRTSPAPPAALVGSFECALDENLVTRVICWFEPAAEKTTSAPAAAATTSTAAPAAAAAGAAAPEKATGASGQTPDNLDVILDIDMPLSVRFGEAVLSLDLLTRLGPGSLIELSRQPDDPVDVLINGRLVARGEVVVVSGNYGVRVTEVVSAAERLRSMGA